MSGGQARVLTLLLVLLGLQLLLNPTFRSNLQGELLGKVPAQTTLAGFLGWGVGGLALVALADPAPMASTWIVVLFIITTLLTRSQNWAGALDQATKAMQTLTTAPASGGVASAK